MTVRINREFSPPLPVNGGCPQGSLLGAYLFNVSVDDIEQTPAAVLQESTENDIRIGDFFDSIDADYLRDTELICNADSTLIPLVTLPSTDQEVADDFDQNGSLTFESFKSNISPRSHSTPIQSSDTPVDIFAIRSPSSTRSLQNATASSKTKDNPLELSDLSDLSDRFEFLPDRPRCIIYTD